MGFKLYFPLKQWAEVTQLRLWVQFRGTLLWTSKSLLGKGKDSFFSGSQVGKLRWKEVKWLFQGRMTRKQLPFPIRLIAADHSAMGHAVWRGLWGSLPCSSSDQFLLLSFFPVFFFFFPVTSTALLFFPFCLCGLRSEHSEFYENVEASSPAMRLTAGW